MSATKDFGLASAPNCITTLRLVRERESWESNPFNSKLGAGGIRDGIQTDPFQF